MSLLFSFTSCNETRKYTLDQAESVMKTDVNEASSVLDSLKCNSSTFSEKEKVRYLLLSLECSYRETQSFEDSLITEVYAYYLVKEDYYSLREKILVRLFYSIFLYNTRCLNEALFELEEVNANLALLDDPYLCAVCHFYLGMIHTTNDSQDIAHSYFRTELQFIEKTKDPDKIANTCQHYALSFLRLNQPDSCQYYIARSLSYITVLSPNRLKMIYNNVLAIKQLNLFIWDIPVDYYLKEITSLLNHMEYSSQALVFVTNFIFQNGKNLPIYEEYNKEYSNYRDDRIQNFYCLLSNNICEISFNDKRRIEMWLSILIVTCGVFLSLGIIFFLKKKRKIKQLTDSDEKHRQQIKKLNDELRHNQTKLEDKKAEIEIYRKEKCKLNKKISEQNFLLYKMFARFFLKKKGIDFDSQNYHELSTLYSERNSTSYKIIDILRNQEVKFSDREILLCIIFYEGKEEDLLSIMNFTSPNALKTAKSRLKSKLISLHSKESCILKLIEQLS